jgi:multidrug transporter EmrE-like cation transporter
MAGALSMAYLCVVLTVVLTVVGQLLLKWQASSWVTSGQRTGLWRYLLTMLANPWVLCGLTAAFGASLCWMLAVSKLPLHKAYPFMALNFVLVGWFSSRLFGEPYTVSQAVGAALIVLGVIVSGIG